MNITTSSSTAIVWSQIDVDKVALRHKNNPTAVTGVVEAYDIEIPDALHFQGGLLRDVILEDDVRGKDGKKRVALCTVVETATTQDLHCTLSVRQGATCRQVMADAVAKILREIGELALSLNP